MVGAGTSGAAAALFLAQAGLHTALVDERPFESAGARWLNGVPGWMFDRAGIERPDPPELRSAGRPFTMRSPAGNAQLTVTRSPSLSVDMRLLVRRLQRLGLSKGVVRFEAARLCDVELDNGRPRRIMLEVGGSDGKKFSERALDANLFVDASGMNAVLRRRVPALDEACKPPERSDICSAAQEVCKISNRAAAEAFLERNRVRAGEFLCVAGVHGGYSIAKLCVEEDFETVELLTGAVVNGRRPSGSQIIAEMKSREPWIGERIFGGSGAIPIRRPYDRQSAPGIALLGDAGCQVFPAHASGIGTGLIAARILAENVGDDQDPGSERALMAYQVGIQRELGPLLAGYDVFRRFSQTLSADDVDSLITSGLMSVAGCRAGMAQKFPELNLGYIHDVIVGALRQPKLVLRMLPTLVKMSLVRFAYRLYPASPTNRRFRLWSKVVARLAGD